jgi:hypothetical protein
MPHIASEVDQIRPGDFIKALVRKYTHSLSLTLLNSRIQGCEQADVNTGEQCEFSLLGKAIDDKFDSKISSDMVIRDLKLEDLGLCGYANSQAPGGHTHGVDFMQLKQMQNLKWSKEAC